MDEQRLPATRWRGKSTEYLVMCALCGAQRYVRKGRENTPCRHCRADVTYPDKLTASPLYQVWRSMVKRCTNPRCKQFKMLLLHCRRPVQIAPQFGVSHQVISNIEYGKNWVDVLPAEEA